MQSTIPLLSNEERTQLTASDELNIGRYRSLGSKGEDHEFIVALDAQPLSILFEAASFGSRLYELMTITRPADVLHYLHLTMIEVSEEVLSNVKGAIKFKTRFKEISFENGISFTEFDSCFYLSGDDTEPYEENWVTHRKGSYWHQKMHALLSLTKEVQQRVRQIDDFLIQNEIKLIDKGLHHRDALTHIDRLPLSVNKAYSQTKLPAPLFEMITQLIKRDDVKSVSCPFTDYPLWRILVEEQIRRTQASGLPPHEAFYLSSCDGGQMNLSGADARRYPNEPQDWGGTVHVPYEGATGGDLFIKPDWYRCPPVKLNESGKVSRPLFGRPCRFMLSEIDYGEISSTNRTQIGDWVLYEDTNA